MIIIESKRKKLENILNKYPNAKIIDVTSQSNEIFVKLSPFYPHGDIPVPYSSGVVSQSVEAIWQGLKVFENYDIDIGIFNNRTMSNIKRTARRYGKPLGHRKGINGTELLGYIEARHKIYLPSYKWVLENKVKQLMESLRDLSKKQTIILLDYTTNCDIDNPSKPLSHAFLIKAWIEGIYPFTHNKEIRVKQLTIFDNNE